MLTFSLFSSLLSRPKIRSRVFTLILNKYTLVAIASITLRLTTRKKNRANAKGRAGGRLEDSTPMKSGTKRKLKDNDDLDTEKAPVDIESEDDQ